MLTHAISQIRLLLQRANHGHAEVTATSTSKHQLLVFEDSGVPMTSHTKDASPLGNTLVQGTPKLRPDLHPGISDEHTTSPRFTVQDVEDVEAEDVEHTHQRTPAGPSSITASPAAPTRTPEPKAVPMRPEPQPTDAKPAVNGQGTQEASNPTTRTKPNTPPTTATRQPKVVVAKPGSQPTQTEPAASIQERQQVSAPNPRTTPNTTTSTRQDPRAVPPKSDVPPAPPTHPTASKQKRQQADAASSTLFQDDELLASLQKYLELPMGAGSPNVSKGLLNGVITQSVGIREHSSGDRMIVEYSLTNQFYRIIPNKEIEYFQRLKQELTEFVQKLPCMKVFGTETKKLKTDFMQAHYPWLQDLLEQERGLLIPVFEIPIPHKTVARLYTILKADGVFPMFKDMIEYKYSIQSSVMQFLCELQYVLQSGIQSLDANPDNVCVVHGPKMLEIERLQFLGTENMRCVMVDSAPWDQGSDQWRVMDVSIWASRERSMLSGAGVITANPDVTLASLHDLLATIQIPEHLIPNTVARLIPTEKQWKPTMLWPTYQIVRTESSIKYELDVAANKYMPQFLFRIKTSQWQILVQNKLIENKCPSLSNWMRQHHRQLGMLCFEYEARMERPNDTYFNIYNSPAANAEQLHESLKKWRHESNFNRSVFSTVLQQLHALGQQLTFMHWHGFVHGAISHTSIFVENTTKADMALFLMNFSFSLSSETLWEWEQYCTKHKKHGTWLKFQYWQKVVPLFDLIPILLIKQGKLTLLQREVWLNIGKCWDTLSMLLVLLQILLAARDMEWYKDADILTVQQECFIHIEQINAIVGKTSLNNSTESLLSLRNQMREFQMPVALQCIEKVQAQLDSHAPHANSQTRLMAQLANQADAAVVSQATPGHQLAIFHDSGLQMNSHTRDGSPLENTSVQGTLKPRPDPRIDAGDEHATSPDFTVEDVEDVVAEDVEIPHPRSSAGPAPTTAPTTATTRTQAPEAVPTKPKPSPKPPAPTATVQFTQQAPVSTPKVTPSTAPTTATAVNQEPKGAPVKPEPQASHPVPTVASVQVTQQTSNSTTKATPNTASPAGTAAKQELTVVVAKPKASPAPPVPAATVQDAQKSSYRTSKMKSSTVSSTATTRTQASEVVPLKPDPQPNRPVPAATVKVTQQANTTNSTMFHDGELLGSLQHYLSPPIEPDLTALERAKLKVAIQQKKSVRLHKYENQAFYCPRIGVYRMIPLNEVLRFQQLKQQLTTFVRNLTCMKMFDTESIQFKTCVTKDESPVWLQELCDHKQGASIPVYEVPAPYTTVARLYNILQHEDVLQLFQRALAFQYSIQTNMIQFLHDLQYALQAGIQSLDANPDNVFVVCEHALNVDRMQLVGTESVRCVAMDSVLWDQGSDHWQALNTDIWASRERSLLSGAGLLTANPHVTLASLHDLLAIMQFPPDEFSRGVYAIRPRSEIWNTVGDWPSYEVKENDSGKAIYPVETNTRRVATYDPGYIFFKKSKKWNIQLSTQISTLLRCQNDSLLEWMKMHHPKLNRLCVENGIVMRQENGVFYTVYNSRQTPSDSLHRSLIGWMKDKNLSSPECGSMLQQLHTVTEQLLFLHWHGFAHGAISTSTIFIDISTSEESQCYLSLMNFFMSLSSETLYNWEQDIPPTLKDQPKLQFWCTAVPLFRVLLGVLKKQGKLTFLQREVWLNIGKCWDALSMLLVLKQVLTAAAEMNWYRQAKVAHAWKECRNNIQQLEAILGKTSLDNSTESLLSLHNQMRELQMPVVLRCIERVQEQLKLYDSK